MKRAICPICKLNTAVKKTGRFVRHGRSKDATGKVQNNPCPGSDSESTLTDYLAILDRDRDLEFNY